MNDLSDADTTTAAQNDLLTFNNSAIDATCGDRFFPKNVGSIFTGLEPTVNALVGINTAMIRPREVGDPAKTDMVLFADPPAGTWRDFLRRFQRLEQHNNREKGAV